MSKEENTMKCGYLNGGFCSLGHFNAKPTNKDCLSCEDYDGTSRGLGDDIAALTKKYGVEGLTKKIAKRFDVDCGCKDRQKKWNEMFPHESED